MIYTDTSLILKCYLQEPGTDDVLRWAEGRRGLACSVHGCIEFHSTILRHVREKRLTTVQARKVLVQLDADEHEGLWRWLPVTDGIVRRTYQVLGRFPAGLRVRAADALHLATAAEHECETVYTHDAHMLEAAQFFSLTGVDPVHNGRSNRSPLL